MAYSSGLSPPTAVESSSEEEEAAGEEEAEGDEEEGEEGGEGEGGARRRKGTPAEEACGYSREDTENFIRKIGWLAEHDPTPAGLESHAPAEAAAGAGQRGGGAHAMAA